MLRLRLAVIWCLCAMILVLALAPGLSMMAHASGPVRFYYFYDPICGSCEETRTQVVDPLLAEYGARLEMTAINMRDAGSMELLLALEESLGVAGSGEIPVVFIGDEMLCGFAETSWSLRDLVASHAEQGGVDLPDAACQVGGDGICAPRDDSPQLAEAAAPIHAVYFYQPGCDECDRAEHDLRYLQERYPQLVLERYSVRERATFNQYLCDSADVPEASHLTAPALFVGDGYLTGSQVRASAIEDLIQPLLSTGSPDWWAGWDAESAQAEENIVRRFEAFGLLTVVGAGLLDGINPCAFATMIFLISYLSVRKRQGKELLLTGAAFASGVFITYLAVGLGLITFLDSLPFLDTLGLWFYGFTAAICLALAVGSLRDCFKARQGALHKMGLTLPDALRKLSHRLIRKGTSHKRFVLSAFALGAGISIVELACTGQVYLPTILYVLGVPALRARATLTLVLYNLMFIAPLVGIFILVYYGTTSEQMGVWLKRHAATVKLGMACLFLVLAGWLLYSILMTTSGGRLV